MSVAPLAILATFSLFTFSLFLPKLALAETKMESRMDAKIERKEKMEISKLERKSRLEEISDKKKANLAIRISDQLNTTNQNRTAAMEKNLSRLSSILDKVSSILGSNQEVTDAKSAIATAQTAVAAQADKDYTIQYTSESKLKTDAMADRNQLRTDLTTTHKTVINAKLAVEKAIKALKVKETNN